MASCYPAKVNRGLQSLSHILRFRAISDTVEQTELPALLRRKTVLIFDETMGGGHAVDIGFRNVNTYSTIGVFSAAVPALEEQTLLTKYLALSGSEPSANRLKEFRLPIGEKDFLLGRSEEFHSRLKSIGIRHEFRKNSGGHEGNVWREYHPEFLERVAGDSVARSTKWLRWLFLALWGSACGWRRVFCCSNA